MGNNNYEIHDLDLYADQMSKILPVAHMGIWTL